MSSDWKSQTIRDCLAEEFSGEWGEDPGHAAPNARVLRSTNLDDDGHLDLGRGALRRIPAMQLTQKKLKDGDVLLEASGGGPNTPVGRVAHFMSDERGLYLCSNFFRVLRSGPACESRFLAWRLLQVYRESTIWRFQQQTTGIINLKYREYLAHVIGLPPLPEQRRIAEILDTVDKAIRKTEEVIAKLQQMKQGLLHDLLTRGIDDNGELRDPERHPEQFKDSELGNVPRVWNLAPLGSLADIVRGSTPRPAKDPRYFDGDFVPWITVGQLSRDTWPYLEQPEQYLTELGSRFSRELPAGVLVLSNSGFGCGVPKLLSFRGCANDGIAAFLSLDPSVNPLFLYYYLASRTLWLRRVVARGNDQPNLNTDLISAVPALTPGREEQDQIAAVLYEVDSRVRREEAVLAKLRVQKSALMDDLLTGRVRVPTPSEATP